MVRQVICSHALTNVSELTVLHTLEYDLMDVPLQDFTCRQPPGAILPIYVASLSLTMRLGPQILQVELCWKERTLCSAEILCGGERFHTSRLGFIARQLD
jgi:hypothetical protein